MSHDENNALPIILIIMRGIAGIDTLMALKRSRFSLIPVLKLSVIYIIF